MHNKIICLDEELILETYKGINFVDINLIVTFISQTVQRTKKLSQTTMK